MKRILSAATLVILGLAAGTALLASLLPFLDTQWWAIRLLDFPRLQVAIAAAALLIAAIPFAGSYPRTVVGLAVAFMTTIVVNAAVLWPYKPAGATAAKTCPDERRLDVMIANVLLTNRTARPILEAVRAVKPDLFLAMEVDGWWDSALEPLAADMPHGITKITGSYYGIRFFSRLPLGNVETRFLAGRDTPSVIADVRLRDGGTALFVGLHPRPPLVGQSALPRDAELYAAADILRRREGPAILAGDLNAVPWEQAVARTRRLAGLVAPRQGRGFVYTFDAMSWWAKWPLDQIDIKPGFTVLSLQRLAPIGSDHYPYLVRLCHDGNGETQAPPGVSEDDRAHVDAANKAAASASP